MEEGDDSSDDSGDLKQNIVLLFLTAYLGYTITDTYFILWLSEIFGEGNVSVANMVGAVLAVFVGIGIMKMLRCFDDVNKKVFAGSVIYVMLEVVLYFILSGCATDVLLVIVFVLDNLALITYSAPIETLAIKLVGRDKSVEVGTLSTRLYIIAAAIGAAVAYILYPDYAFILLASAVFKVFAGIMALFFPPVENHDSIEFEDIFDPDLVRTLPMTVASEVFYLTSPVIIAGVVGAKTYGIYVIIMEVVYFATVSSFAKSNHLGKIAIVVAVLILLEPVAGFLLFYSVMNAMVLRSRAEIIDEWGVDDSVTGVNIQKVLGAIFAMPFVKVFGASVWTLSFLVLLSVLAYELPLPRGRSFVKGNQIRGLKPRNGFTQ